MDVSRNGGDIVFRTPFSPTHDLIQIMCGIAPGDPSRNNPVDFKLAALQRRGNVDIWHADQVLSYATDECPPYVINGEDIGGNHGHTCAVRALAPEHGFSDKHAGSQWLDDSGMHWTLMRVENADSLLFLSDNTGKSLYEYDFADHIEGCLRMQDHTLPIAHQQGHVQLTPAIRHLQRDAVCMVNGQWQPVTGEVIPCECAEIREVYEVLNPATIAAALRGEAPAQAMLLHRMTYRIQPDGTILCDFDHRLLQPVRLTHYLGVMHQEKCDVFGGGVWRTIPGLKPFEDSGHWFDFSVPYCITGRAMPNWRTLTPDLWADPLCPPDRQYDAFLRPDGSCAAVFASGFLPQYDGEPSRRAHNMTDAGDMVPSCKTYPTFAGGRAGRILLSSLRGVAYRKYAPTLQDCMNIG